MSDPFERSAVAVLRAELAGVIDRARRVDPAAKVVAIEAVEALLGPARHVLTVDPDGTWTVTHARDCRRPDCDISLALRRAPILSSPHALGHTYEVSFDDRGALVYRGVTP